MNLRFVFQRSKNRRKGCAVKRIAASILLLLVAFFISKPFAAESSNLALPAKAVIGYTHNQTDPIESKQSSPSQLSALGCLCDSSFTNPTITLLLIAAVAASLAMAAFIYGSHFIATWVAG